MKLQVGQKATRTTTLTRDDVRSYAELTGDFNPLHFDESFAAKTQFKHLIVQGGLTTGLLHALVATDMPGRARHCISEPKLAIPRTGVYWRYHNRGSGNLRDS